MALLWTCRDDLGDLNSHLTNTCHLQRSSSTENDMLQEEDAVKLLSELPQVTGFPELSRLLGTCSNTAIS